MQQTQQMATLPRPLRLYIALTFVAGSAWLAYLVAGTAWGASDLAEMGLFVALIVVAGSFPIPVAPKVKTDVTTAVLFCAVLVLSPGAAAVAATVGMVSYTFLLRYWGAHIRLPWYKYPFNGASTALYVGLSAAMFDRLSANGELLLPALAAAGVGYFANTLLVSAAVTLQTGISPIRFWATGTRQNGLMEVSLLASGFLGAVVYVQSPWYLAALFVPVLVTYIAFSRLSQKIGQLEEAKEEQRKTNDYLELRVQARTAELAMVNEELELSRRRIVSAQEELRKAVVQQLHGPVQNRLILVAHRLKAAQEIITSDPAASAEQMATATEMLDDITQAELRAVMRRLHPSLIRMSLEASLRSLGDEFKSSFQVDVQTTGPEDLWRAGLQEELRLAIFRVAEEALSNVLKHSQATTVEVCLSDQPREDGFVTLEVRDDGIGFDVGSTAPGFGVLSMQDYCGAVGGKLRVNSKPGEGTVISAMFPVALARDEGFSFAHSPGTNGSASKQPTATGPRLREGLDEPSTRIVVVDDLPDFRGLVRELLKPYSDFSIVAEGHDGATAIDLVEEHRPDIVLLDIEMPGLHGLTTADEIHSRFPEVKVILMSAYHQREYIEDGLNPSVVDVIPKAELSVARLRQARLEAATA